MISNKEATLSVRGVSCKTSLPSRSLAIDGSIKILFEKPSIKGEAINSNSKTFRERSSVTIAKHKHIVKPKDNKLRFYFMITKGRRETTPSSVTLWEDNTTRKTSRECTSRHGDASPFGWSRHKLLLLAIIVYFYDSFCEQHCLLDIGRNSDFERASFTQADVKTLFITPALWHWQR